MAPHAHEACEPSCRVIPTGGSGRSDWTEVTTRSVTVRSAGGSRWSTPTTSAVNQGGQRLFSQTELPENTPFGPLTILSALWLSAAQNPPPR